MRLLKSKIVRAMHESFAIVEEGYIDGWMDNCRDEDSIYSTPNDKKWHGS